MKTIYLIVLSFTVFLSACADPAANKPKAEISAPTGVGVKTADAPSETGVKATRLAVTPGESTIAFTGSKVTGKHEGGFKSFSGTIDLVGDKAESGKVQFEIDMPSVFTDTDGLTKHLQTGDFFDVAKFPKSSFVSTAIAPAGTGGDNFSVTGDLELRGVKKSVTFPATIRITPEAVTVKAEFAINRKDFGIAYAGKADDLIRDDVVIRLDLKTPKKP